MLSIFGTCLILIGFTNAEVRITNYKELTEVGFNAFLSCSSELNVNIDVCFELLDAEIKHNDAKFDGCKCLIACVSKRIGTMNIDDGKWNEKRYLELSAMFENEEWRKDLELVGQHCNDRVNSHCSASYPLFKCALSYSKTLKGMADNFLKQKQAVIDAANSTAEYEDDVAVPNNN